jgi:hypothetical protein
VSAATLPDKICSVEELEDHLSRPPDYVVEALRKLEGDLLILGVAGKMGPTLARMAKRAVRAAGGSPRSPRVIGVARFTNPSHQSDLEQLGIETIKADLLDPAQLSKLPDVPNIVYMPAMKFGSTGQESLTWAMNTYLAGTCAQRFAKSKIVAFSTGNVYGLSPVVAGGSTESASLNPVGDYAQSCVGRERLFEHFSRTLHIPTALIRLNYATELRYGVMVDMAQKVWSGATIDLSMGWFNAIWQGDANAMTLASFSHVASPPFVINVAGPELLRVRAVCEEFGRLMNKPPKFEGVESPDALLSNGQLGHQLFGCPRVPAATMLRWIAAWVISGGKSLGKPTHFEARDGKY